MAPVAGSKRMSPALPLNQRSPRASGTMPYSVSLDSPSARDRTSNSISSGGAAGSTTRASPPPSVATQTRPSCVDGERVHGVRRQRRRVGRIVAEHLQHRAVGTREIEAAAFGAEPEIAARVFGDRRHDRLR